MTKEEILARQQQALTEFRQLPAEERFRLLQEWGTIDENGEVQLASPEDKHDEEE